MSKEHDYRRVINELRTSGVATCPECDGEYRWDRPVEGSTVNPIQYETVVCHACTDGKIRANDGGVL